MPYSSIIKPGLFVPSKRIKSITVHAVYGIVWIQSRKTPERKPGVSWKHRCEVVKVAPMELAARERIVVIICGREEGIGIKIRPEAI